MVRGDQGTWTPTEEGKPAVGWGRGKSSRSGLAPVSICPRGPGPRKQNLFLLSSKPSSVKKWKIMGGRMSPGIEGH